MNLSPIVLFTYRRVAKETIESLLQNKLSKESELFIYSDGYKNEIDKQDVLKVRSYLKSIKGFKNITIFEASKNNGLANSIISGITEIINQYKKVIALEDDLIISADFLEYMNDALEFYKNDINIWSISGYSPELPCLKDYKKDLYLSPRGSSWGWATWKDRWDTVDWDVKDFEKLKLNKLMRKEFERGGNDMFRMLELQILGKIDSWAIRWCFSQFLQKSYTVYPVKSKVKNIGFNDLKGTHNSGSSAKWDVKISDMKVNFENLEEEENIIQCWKKYCDINIYTKIGYFLRKHGLHKIAKKIIAKYNKFLKTG